MRTSWNLELLYTSPHDPRIKRDIVAFKHACDAFEKKYKNRTDYLFSEKKLFKALTDYEVFVRIVSAQKSLLYYHYRKELNRKDEEAQAALTKLSGELTKYGNKVLFFEIAIGKIPLTLQKKFLKSKLLAPFHYYLERVFEGSKHDLTEPEEKILQLTALPRHGLWIDGVEKALHGKSVRWGGKDIALTEAEGKIGNLPTNDRRALQDAVLEAYKSISDFAESELNAVITDKKITDELRKFPKSYSATVLDYENDEHSVLRLVALVTNNFSISRRFYNLKAKMLGLPTLEYADRSASLGGTRERMPYEKSLALFKEVLGGLSNKFVDILDAFSKNGQIDVYPKIGKAGGAYCSSGIDVPTMVLLNHTDDFRSFTTLAHEMGHAIHSEMSKVQPPLYQDYTIPVAETASTLFEQLAFAHVFKTLNVDDKIVALHNKLNDDIATVFRQIAFFNFELDLHTQIRAKGSLPKEEIARLLNLHIGKYLGPRFRLRDLDGYFFVTVSHFRRFFYVYAYAYGHLVSRAMAARVSEDPSFVKDVIRFLSAGGSKTPENIFKDIGIDTRKENIFKEGILAIERSIEELEKLFQKKEGKKDNRV